MEFDYFYNRDGARYSFYMLPKILISGDIFKNLSSDSKILYSCLLERTSLSAKNNWLDKDIYAQIELSEQGKVTGLQQNIF